MPIKQAAFKALRQAKKRAFRNAKVKGQISEMVKDARKLVLAKKPADASEMAKKAIKAIDKAVQKKVLKMNTAARTKSRLLAFIKKIK